MLVSSHLETPREFGTTSALSLGALCRRAIILQQGLVSLEKTLYPSYFRDASRKEWLGAARCFSKLRFFRFLWETLPCPIPPSLK